MNGSLAIIFYTNPQYKVFQRYTGQYLTDYSAIDWATEISTQILEIFTGDHLLLYKHIIISYPLCPTF